MTTVNKHISIFLLCAGLVLGGAACRKDSATKTTGGADAISNASSNEVVNASTNENANASVNEGNGNASESGNALNANSASANANATTTNVNVPTNTNGAQTNTPTNSANVPNATNANVPLRATVSVTSSGFSPRSVTIAAGGTVTWTNGAGKTAYVAPDDHPSHRKYRGIWDDTGDGQIGDGASSTQTFRTAGTYTYHDHLNASRAGTVIVE